VENGCLARGARRRFIALGKQLNKIGSILETGRQICLDRCPKLFDNQLIHYVCDICIDPVTYAKATYRTQSVYARLQMTQEGNSTKAFEEDMTLVASLSSGRRSSIMGSISSSFLFLSLS
jgi:hypothetical protein